MDTTNIVNFGVTQSLLSNLSTGNLIFDAMLMMMLSSMISNISFDNILKMFGKLKDCRCKIKKRQAHISFKSKKNEVSKCFKAIIFYVLKHKKENISDLKEMFNKYYDYEDGYDKTDEYFIMDDCSELKIGDDIYLEVNHYDEDEKISDKTTKKIRYCDLVIYTYKKKNGSVYLTDFIKICENEYEEHLQRKICEGQRFFNCKCSKKEDDCFPDIDDYPFNTNKSFDNVFFDNKDEVISKIEFFQNNKTWYEQRGIPYTMGILLYGEPGCGKTSFIKALLKKLDRHAISIDLDGLVLEQFRDLIFSSHIEDYKIPQDKRLYILEDIDCMGEIVKDRDLKDKEFELDSDDEKKEKDSKKEDKTATVENKTEHHMNKLMNTFKKMTFDTRNEDNNNLSKLLNIIDGIIETPGRVLIMTTNKVEYLDKALVRPGRIDIKINFTKCSYQMMIDIINNYFQTTFSLEEFKLFCTYTNNKQEFQYTPAELIQLCSTYGNTDKLFEFLRENSNSLLAKYIKKD